MALDVKHAFVSEKEDDEDATLVRPSNWNANHVLRWTLNKLLKGAGPDNPPTEIDVPVGAPSGVIVMWHGLISNIPAGWVICDGNNNTPNLLAKFVQGVATAVTNPGATGGEASHRLTQSEIPPHQHDFYVYNGEGAEGYARSGDNGYQQFTASTKSAIGSADLHENRPPFYDIAFIMKT